MQNSSDLKKFLSELNIKDSLNIVDDGFGIPPRLQNLIFQSRVTSKLENGIKDPYGFHGRGMALFSIKLNVDDIRIIFSEKSKGASFYIDIDLSKIPEKKDQSLMPQIIKTDGNLNIIGGVNNIIKTIIEFQLQNREINFFFGSPTQILSTMREILRKDGEKNDYPKFDEWEKLSKFIQKNNLKVTEIPILTDNYTVMQIISKNIFNMEISQRGIQRVIYNEIKALKPLKIDPESISEELRVISSKDKEKEDKIPDKKLILYDESKLASRFKDDEIRCIIKAAEDKIRELGDKYFVTTGENIEYKKANNIIKLSIELKQKE